MLGVTLTLYDGATPQANLSDIQALWWDVEEPYDFSTPTGRTNVAVTDASGIISLDLSSVSGLEDNDLI